MWFWYLSHKRPAKAQASLRIRAVTPEPSLFAYMTKGPTKNQTSSPTGWLCMGVWRMSLRRTESTIISWDGPNIFSFRFTILWLTLCQINTHIEIEVRVKMSLICEQWIQYILLQCSDSAHVLLNLLNSLGKKEKMQGFAEHLIGFPPLNLINSIIQEYECKILFIYHMTLKSHFISNFHSKTSGFRH